MNHDYNQPIPAHNGNDDNETYFVPGPEFIAILHGLARLFTPLNKVRRLTYGNAIKYFVENRPDIPDIRGIIYYEETDQGNFITQLFIDGNDDILRQTNDKPIGRRILVRSIDHELAELLEEQRLIVVT